MVSYHFIHPQLRADVVPKTAGELQLFTDMTWVQYIH